jgi:hypothetical protein
MSARFVEGANVADANGWTGGGMGSTLDSKWETLKALLQAGGGEPVRLGGLLSCNFQTPRTSLATINAADLIGEAKAVATQPRRDRFNTAVPRYRSEDHGWEVVSADPITVVDLCTTDGGTRTKELDYPFVQARPGGAACRLRYHAVARVRPDHAPAEAEMDRLQAGRRGHGHDRRARPVVAEMRDRQADAGPGHRHGHLELRSETDAKHSFAFGTTTTAPPTPTLTPSGTPFVVTTAEDLGIIDNAGTGYTPRVGAVRT